MLQNDYFTCFFFVIIQIPRPNVKGKLNLLNHIFFFTLRESEDLARR